MKKNIFIVFILIIIILLVFFIFSNREITLKESHLREIFVSNNFDNVEIFFTDVLENEKEGVTNMEKKILFFNSIKDEKIKPIIFENLDKVNSGNVAYRMIIKYNNRTYRLIVFSDNTLVINKKRYTTKNNLFELMFSIFGNVSL